MAGSPLLALIDEGLNKEPETRPAGALTTNEMIEAYKAQGVRISRKRLNERIADLIEQERVARGNVRIRTKDGRMVNTVVYWIKGNLDVE